MIDVASFLKEKPVPDWFAKHTIFKEVTRVNKIFPAIGLENFDIESDIDVRTSILPFIRDLLDDMGYYISTPKYSISNNINNQNKTTYTNIVFIINDFIAQLAKYKLFYSSFKDKNGLYLNRDILNNKKQIFAKKGESLFKVYGKIRVLIEKYTPYKCAALENLPGFKEYSANNIGGKMRVVFSSDGNDGAWDILTMSMRGISSCQSWSGQYKQCVIGSVLDPFTAIIYLTAGSKLEHGTKMIRRSVVRFVVDSSVQKPCLFLEFLYPGEHKATMEAFKKAIQTKIGDKFPIITKHSGLSQYYVPYSNITPLLVKHSGGSGTYINNRGQHNYGILPYRDCFMKYKIPVTPIGLTPVKVHQLQNRYIKDISSKLQNTTYLREPYIATLTSIINRDVFSKIDYATYTDLKKYSRDICHYYFSNKIKINDLILKEIYKLKRTRKDTLIVIPVPKTKLTSISNTVSDKIIPVISNTFKNGWKKSMISNTKK